MQSSTAEFCPPIKDSFSGHLPVTCLRLNDARRVRPQYASASSMRSPMAIFRLALNPADHARDKIRLDPDARAVAKSTLQTAHTKRHTHQKLRNIEVLVPSYLK